MSLIDLAHNFLLWFCPFIRAITAYDNLKSAVFPDESLRKKELLLSAGHFEPVLREHNLLVSSILLA